MVMLKNEQGNRKNENDMNFLYFNKNELSNTKCYFMLFNKVEIFFIP